MFKIGEKKIATNICAVCIHKKDRNRASFCNNCVNLHRCGEKMALPIVNSPRDNRRMWLYSLEKIIIFIRNYLYIINRGINNLSPLS